MRVPGLGGASGPVGRLVLAVVVLGIGAAGAVGAIGTAGWQAAMSPQARQDLGNPSATSQRPPVLLVPGWADEADQFGLMRSRFVAAGWPEGSVVALSFADPVGSNRDHARTLAEAITDLRASTGAEHVDVVAHSMGGLALRHYLLQVGGDEVRRVVFMATPHRGTYAAYVAWGEGGREMSPGSDFLLELNEPFLPLPLGVEGITIRTPVDLHILPPESATLPPLPDIEICCPTHAGLLDDEETFEAVRSFLERGN